MLFLPSCIRQLMNLLASFVPKRGSGQSRALLAVNLRAMRNPLLLLGGAGALGGGAVVRASLLAVAHALPVEGAAHDVLAAARQVADAAAADEHDRVLLEVVPLAGDVGRDLLAV